MYTVHNDREFVNAIFIVKEYWSELNLFLFFIWSIKSRHSKYVGLKTIKHGNGQKVCHLYEKFMKNRGCHFGIKQSPYKTMFEIELKVGLSIAYFPLTVISTVQNKKDLN